MKAISLGGVILLVTTLGPSSASHDGATIKLPAELASYRQWTQLSASPYEVPIEFAFRCVATTEADWKAARQTYGPHTRYFIRVYGNDVAAKAFSAGGRGSFPVGAVIAKEKFARSPNGAPDGVGFMVKRAEREFPESGGWQFLYYPSSADQRAVQQACAPCHRNAPRDHVFGSYPR